MSFQSTTCLQSTYFRILDFPSFMQMFSSGFNSNNLVRTLFLFSFFLFFFFPSGAHRKRLACIWSSVFRSCGNAYCIWKWQHAIWIIAAVFYWKFIYIINASSIGLIPISSTISFTCTKQLFSHLFAGIFTRKLYVC